MGQGLSKCANFQSDSSGKPDACLYAVEGTWTARLNANEAKKLRSMKKEREEREFSIRYWRVGAFPVHCDMTVRTERRMCVFCGPSLMGGVLTWTPTSHRHRHRHHCCEPLGPRTGRRIDIFLCSLLVNVIRVIERCNPKYKGEHEIEKQPWQWIQKWRHGPVGLKGQNVDTSEVSPRVLQTSKDGHLDPPDGARSHPTRGSPIRLT